jgi:hypothetical protein
MAIFLLFEQTRSKYFVAFDFFIDEVGEKVPQYPFAKVYWNRLAEVA